METGMSTSSNYLKRNDISGIVRPILVRVLTRRHAQGTLGSTDTSSPHYGKTKSPKSELSPNERK